MKGHIQKYISHNFIILEKILLLRLDCIPTFFIDPINVKLTINLKNC